MARRTGSKRAFTTVEALVALVIALLVIGIVFAVFTPAQRQGAQLEMKLQTVRGVMLLAGRLEQDVQQAHTVSFDGDAMVLTTDVLDRSAEPRMVRRSVRYGHKAMGPVQRTASADAAARDGSAVGSCRFARVAFAAVEGDPGAVRVTVEPLPSRRDAEAPSSFVVRLPLVGGATEWPSAIAKEKVQA